MQHRAAALIEGPSADAELRAYLELLSSTAPLSPPAPASPAPASAAASDAEQAYLALLSSTAPLTPSPSSGHDAAAQAYLDLLVSAAPLMPADLLPATASSRPVRRTGHRAAAGARGRYAVVTAALAVGVGIAGIGVAADAAPSHADTPTIVVSPAAAASPTEAPAPDPAVVALTERDLTVRAPVTPTEQLAASSPARSAVRAQQKVKPKPKPVPPPVAWVNPMPGASTTSCFGPRWGRLHAGVDLAAPQGTPIRAAGAGVVVSAGEAGGYGNAVLIDHGNGYLTHYGHMLTITTTVGRQVKVGEQIGLEGSTGHSTGPHLHFEVHEGSYKNQIEPTAWMRAHGVDIPGCDTAAAPADEHEHDHEEG